MSKLAILSKAMLGILGFFRLTRLEFVRMEKHAGDIACFYFSPTRPLKHRAGQHGVFFLPGFGGFHIFSLASAPEEDLVMIATHVRAGSRYKQRLKNLKKGESMWMIGPVLNFMFRPDVKNYVFLTQGIGITPFRSMLVHQNEAQLDVHTTLVHVDSGDHTFKSLTGKLADKAVYVSNVTEFQKEAVAATKDKGAYFYLSGSPRFNSETRKLLVENGISSSRIKKDGFLGY